MSFLESRVSFSSNFASRFSVMRNNSSILFHLKLYMLWKKRAHQSANFHRLHSSVSWKITPPSCSLNAVYFAQKKLIAEIFSDFWVIGLKFTKFLMSYFKPPLREKRPNTEFFLVCIVFVFGLNTKIYCVNCSI